MWHRAFCTSLMLFSVLASIVTNQLLAGDITVANIGQAAKQAAKDIAEELRDQREVFIHEFRVTNFGGSSNIGISKAIGDELKEKGFDIKAGARNEVEGRLSRVPSDESQPLTGFDMSIKVLTGGKERKLQLSMSVTNVAEAAVAVEPTGELRRPPIESAKPPVSAPTIRNASLALPSPTSPYAVEVLVETSPGKYEPRPMKLDPIKIREPESDSDRILKVLKVDLKKSEIYAIKLVNNTDYDAAVGIFIDGLSRFAVADDPDDRVSMDIVKPKSIRIIKGYFRTNKSSNSFKVGEHSESVAAKLLPNSLQVGTIAVIFAAAWEKGRSAPVWEKGNPLASPNATGEGPAVEDHVIDVVRETGQVRAVIKILY